MNSLLRPASVAALAGLWLVTHAEPQAPPTAPEPLIRPPAESTRPGLAAPAAPGVLWSIGDPTDEEQLHLELINRTRLDPVGEAARLKAATDEDVLTAYGFFSVDLARMQADIAALPPAPPLALNARLTDAARGHTQFMFDNQIQTHDQNGVGLGQRAANAGYNWSTLGESVYAYAKSVYHGYAGFEVDWGGSAATGGMQSPPGHRLNNHNVTFREAGIGVIKGTNGPVGPQLVTIDFGDRQDATPLVTGVAYFDFNGNQFYDLGEGLPGVQVTVGGSSYYATTTQSGGYAVPTANGSHLVQFTAPGLAPVSRTVNVSGGNNVKVDLPLAYVPPVVNGPTTVGVGLANNFTFTLAPGASAYEWRASRIAAYTAVEGAENGTAKVVAEITGNYPLIVTDIKASGAASFRLAHVDGNDQVLTLVPNLRPGAQGEIRFASRLSYAKATQTAHLQVTADGGRTWEDLWTQAGSGDAGETTFQRRTISLAAYAGRIINARFVYAVGSGSFFSGIQPASIGLHLDDISFGDTVEVGQATGGVAGPGTFAFNPAATGGYSLQVRALAGTRQLPYGPGFDVQTGTVIVPPVVRCTGATVGPNGKVRIDFVLEAGSPAGFSLQSANEITGGWNPVAGVTLATNSPGNFSFKGASPPTPGRGFFRVLAQ